jgi:hypothetical protein
MFDQTRMAIAGWACLVSGVALAAAGILAHRSAGGAPDPAATRLALRFAVVCAGGLASGAHALAAPLAQPLRRTGAALVYAGLAAWVIGGLLPSAPPEAFLLVISLGGALQSGGLLALGVAALRAGAPRGRLRYVPLLAGAWSLAALPLQLTLSAGARPSPLLLLGGWGVWWALLGALVVARARTAPEG